MKVHGDGHDIPPPPRKRGFVLVGLLLAGLGAWGGYGHWQRSSLAAETQRKTRDFVPSLRTAAVQRVDAPIDLTLPGETQAFARASIFARATGYVAERRVDIGSRVKAGDVLIRIAAPDLDQELAQAEARIGQLDAQLLQARAMVDQARANVNLANVTNNRTSTLAVQGWASRQNADNSQAGVLSQTANLASAEAGVKVAEANIKAQQATVDRLKALTGFKEVVAPFDGVVTTRSVEVGDLVRADGTGTPLLGMDRDDVLRISVNVPQYAAVGVKPGVEASIKVPQLPDRSFGGRVARSSVALLTASRTLSTQVDVPNRDGALRPGLYVYVTLKIPRSEPAIVVPAEALVFNQTGTQVAVARDDGKAEWRTVHVRRDEGRTIEIDQGLSGDERIVLSPPADLRDGQRIERRPDSQDGKPMQAASR
ncbi:MULTISPECIES: efflux RND transporter periplasmic adaptor subunit [Methylobacterium]|uniref:Multidrug resistance protein MdtE n=3 Tax=Pseudomonadota TaxID=1224 RepID=A0ABQ4SP20_9HYPH|nr:MULTISPECIES: efflux RND transporter periplasmic adaptor subunit [Methylobacterium]PIU04400.1 MAG: efflux RND transporter periplasmic adaptor subunit [Methylobacterium sp. CG09_land_8_20_14_0_10_71_15]PIU11224.1 MAG: efflux RND transporter periplasmic adaptor subunit [Methylobacterium sp. CG08_land_8_20_14_0_20_71_15]GBU18163.1 hemolysin D [Methylobacterium sp.]GJE04967.1 Multidrug resistance protein MdtE [Methylobacterium jeotgali]